MFSIFAEKEFQKQLKLAKNGDADSQYFIGLAYENGHGVEQSDLKAIEWYQKAADLKHSQAFYKLRILRLKIDAEIIKVKGTFESIHLTQDTDKKALTFMAFAEQDSAFHKFVIPSNQPSLHSSTHNQCQANLKSNNIGLLRTMLKERLILFDIDNTLIDYYGSVNKTRWTSGSASLWQRFCMAIRILDKRHNIETDFGFITFKDAPDRLALAVMGKLPSELNNFVLVQGVDEQGLLDFLNPAYSYFTNGQPKHDIMLELAKEKGFSNEALWVIDDMEEKVCKPARVLGFTAFNSDVVCDNKEEELKKVKNLINEMLTRANNGISITLDELLPKETIELDKQLEANFENDNAILIEKKQELENSQFDRSFMPIKVEATRIQFPNIREQEGEKGFDTDDFQITNSNEIESNFSDAPNLIHQQPGAITQSSGGFSEFYALFQARQLEISKEALKQKKLDSVGTDLDSSHFKKMNLPIKRKK